MKRIIAVAPHPDDETLGCGGTLLKHASQGDAVYWLTVTQMSESLGYAEAAVRRRAEELKAAAAQYGFAGAHHLTFPPARLDTIPMDELVRQIGGVFREVQPDTVYVPYRGDIHTDHAAVFDAVAACTKRFRYPSVTKVLAYETLSETDFGLNPDLNGFRPTVYVDITPYLERKLDVMRIYASEMEEHPFPRSEKAIRSLAYVRGAASGCEAAEAFMLLREVWL